MKTQLFLFLSLMIFFHSVAQNKAEPTITAIAFYNFENFFDTLNDPLKLDDDFTPGGAYGNTAAVYKKKVQNLATVLSQLGKDKCPEGFTFMGCAEVENEKVLQDVLHHPLLKERHLRDVFFEGPDERGIDCGFIYDPVRFKVSAARSLTVNLGEGERPTRDVLFVSGKLDGEPVYILVNHWPSRAGGESASRPKRALAAAVCKRVADSLMQKDPLTRMVIMGDLNDDPVNESVAKVLQAKGHKEDVQPGGLFNPWWSFYKKGLGTLAYNDTWDLFDQIMLSYGWLQGTAGKWHYADAEVFNRSFLVEKEGQYKGYPKRSYVGTRWNDGYSDHFPTVIFLSK